MLLEPVKPGGSVNLRKIDPTDCCGLTHPDSVQEYETMMQERLPSLQALMMGAACNSVLIVLQGIDTAGKDGTIKHVMSHLNPAGCRVDSFKAPTAEERGHDFLWRAHKVAPALGWIEIFNRSHYEDVLVTRVEKLFPRDVLKPRYEDINRFEELLGRSGTIVMKFFLYMSKEEQRTRLLARETVKEKAWKLSVTDWDVYDKYDDYIEAYEKVLERCSTAQAPWYVVPANHKWFRNHAVARTVCDTLSQFEKAWSDALETRGEQMLAELKARRDKKG
jgi:PPK2 family polyphosphate:nucleotide phosphotransferase